MEKEIHISLKSLWRICFVGLVVFGLIYFRQILLIFMASLILSASMENIIAWFELKKIPRIFSAILVYILLVCIIVGLVYIIAPPLFQNILSLTSELPEILKSNATTKFFKNYLPFINNKSLLTNTFSTDNTLNYVGNLVKNLSTIVLGLSNFFLIILISFYLSLEKRWFKNMLEMFLPQTYKRYFIRLWEKAENKMVFWLYSQIVLSMFLTSMAIIVFYIIDVPYPLLSAVILGLFDFVPFIGPIIATIIIVFINMDGVTASGLVLAICVILQYIQNIFGPYIRSKFLKVDPIVTLFFIAIFGKFGGALGVFVAIPLSTTIVEFLKDLTNEKICDERFKKLI